MQTFHTDRFSHTDDGTLIAEASTLELPPGQFPGVFETTTPVGDPLLFDRVQISRNPGGELAAVIYKQRGGTKIAKIYND